ncbi:polysaccharide pyruvyl transferase family protein [Lachnospiraceae bacterium BSM-380-WT-5A]|uniref:Polysaccharide pyruvyl transferase family protein n=1 Tax=Oliverpabstia intestinalis TaxID=2606633 RepID=A0A7X2P448_9FIRM|nr:polysaccharide pyruvyl transferase family protein [Oliverpabstia intestinalis]MST66800.1 polysaccharide pyruvyl transferase family protein [Oliverpabstia intestinalis]
MNEKIGILTFHKSINYGSVLQSWALSRVISKRFVVEIIDYEPQNYEFLYANYRQWKSWNNIKYNLKRMPLSSALNNQQQLFKKFRYKQLPLSRKKYNYNNGCDIKEEYKGIVVGSDQVWNIRAKDCDPIFFLPFNYSGNKVSYACSINDTDYTEKNLPSNLASEICDFDFISIREESGKNKLEQFIAKQKKVYTLLDPTLLCNSSEYDSLLNDRIVDGKYIFLYNVWTSEAGIQAAKFLSEKLNMPVYTIMTASNVKEINLLKKSGILVDTVRTSPSDFLNFFKYASYIVTESFHGTAFSLIFEKPFVCVSNRTNDERLNSILTLVGLKDRYMKLGELQTFDLKQEIDYEIVTEKKEKRAGECIKLLYKAIGGEAKS